MRQAEPPFKGSSGGNPMFGVCVCWAFRCKEARTAFPSHSLNLEHVTHWGQETNLCAGVRTGEPASLGAGSAGSRARSQTTCVTEQPPPGPALRKQSSARPGQCETEQKHLGPGIVRRPHMLAPHQETDLSFSEGHRGPCMLLGKELAKAGREDACSKPRKLCVCLANRELSGPKAPCVVWPVFPTSLPPVPQGG